MIQPATKLSQGVYWVGVNDDNLRVFDITKYTPYGSTYNAYLVVGNEKSAIIDTAKVDFVDEFIDKIETIRPISEIDYLILNHTEPDHSGSVNAILDKNQNITVIATAPGLSNLKEIVNVPFQSIRAKNDFVLELGGKTLSFSMQPNLHWPDTMFTYLKEDNILFTCDYFGAHYGHYGITSDKILNRKEYVDGMKYYFECLMEPFKPDVLRALEYIREIQPELVCTSHGAVIDQTFMKEVETLYETWAQPKVKNNPPLVVAAYASVYGYTKEMTKFLVEGIQEAFSNEVTVRTIDLVTTNLEEAIKAVQDSDAFLLGSATIMNDAVKPAWDLLTGLNPVLDGGKPAAVYGSYGWSGEAVRYLTERLVQLKMKTFEGLKLRFKPSPTQEQELRDYAKRFVQFMQQ